MLLTKFLRSVTPGSTLIRPVALFSTDRTVERGILFSAPCLDPKIRKEARNLMTTDGWLSKKSNKVEKGILFSAPCLDLDRNGEEKNK